MVALTSVVVALAAGVAFAEPKPKPVDIKAIRENLLVFTDADGGIYVALTGRDGRLFYGVPKSKNLYEQIVTGRSADGSTGKWDIATWAPRVPNFQPGSVGRRDNGTFYRYCGDKSSIELTAVTGDKVKAILDRSTFMSTAMIRRPHLLARDDTGVYYYVDVIRGEYGGKGYRVFVGKKGAMKQRPLTDIATDTGGDVFATKTGDLSIVRDTADAKVTWVKGGKRTQLVPLDTDANSALIFRDLGVYGFTGSICDNF
jgi:hypothetical protein